MNVTKGIRDSGRVTARHWRGWCAGACVATLMSLAGLAQSLPSSQGGTAQSGNGAFRPDKANTVSPVNVRPDANRLMEINTKRVQAQRFAAANAERKRQMAEDSARLLALAAELNAELDKAGTETPPRASMAKAEMIEKLAHAVKEKMKLTVAAP